MPPPPPLTPAVTKLEQRGLLDNTYFIFTSDNGYHLGHHGMKHHKFTPYEEDVRVPLFIRGPGLAAGRRTDYQATMVDLPATILALAGAASAIQAHLVRVAGRK